MKVPILRCSFCDNPAAENHHGVGRVHFDEFTIPVCIDHHRRLTAVLYQVDPNLMLKADSVEERKRRVRLACATLLWALDAKEFS
jgi:hypothetical protein